MTESELRKLAISMGFDVFKRPSHDRADKGLSVPPDAHAIPKAAALALQCLNLSQHGARYRYVMHDVCREMEQLHVLGQQEALRALWDDVNRLRPADTETPYNQGMNDALITALNLITQSHDNPVRNTEVIPDRYR